MKKVILCIALAFTGLKAIAQEETNLQKQQASHEIKLDVTELVAAVRTELSYEYVISKFSGVGASVSLSFSEDDEQNFAFTPYFRQYFFNKKEYGGQGVFIEGNLQVAQGEDEEFVSIFDDSDTPKTTTEWNAVGAGFAVGSKWVSLNGFVFEISAGVGRYFTNEDEEIGPVAYFRGGLLVGYRF